MTLGQEEMHRRQLAETRSHPAAPPGLDDVARDQLAEALGLMDTARAQMAETLSR